MNNVEIKTNGSKIKKFFKVFLFLFILSGILFFVYIRYIEPNIIVVHEQAIINTILPDQFNGFKIAHFSDIHYGSSITENELEKIVKRINELNPDVIVYTGDLINDIINISDEEFNKIKEILSKLNAKLNKYAVIGNNDYGNKEKYIEVMSNAGFKVLENSSDFIYVNGIEPLEFIGTSSSLEGECNIEAALGEDNDYFKIWLNHEPIIFEEMLEKNLHPNILLVGHSLGGLVNIPFYGYLLKQDGVDNYTDDYYRKKRISMYINNGLGTYKYNIRFMNAPSINFYRLYNK